MDQATIINGNAFLTALRVRPSTHLLPSNIAEALLHLPSQTFDAWRARQEPVPTLTIIENQRGYLAGDLVQFVEQEPTRHGTVTIQHRSFADFLTYGGPEDTWVFGMALLDFHGVQRPIDLLTCLELPTAVLAGAHCQHMTLKEYVNVMDDYLFRFEDQQIAETQAITRVEQALRLAPSTRSSSRVHHS